MMFIFFALCFLAMPGLSVDQELYKYLQKNSRTSQCSHEEIEGYNRALKEAIDPGKNYVSIPGLIQLKKMLSVSAKRNDPETKIDPITGFREGHGSDSLLPNQIKVMSIKNTRYFQEKLDPYYAPDKSLHDSLEVLTPEKFCLLNYYMYIGTPADKIEKELKDLFFIIKAIENLPRLNVYALASYIYRRLIAIHPFMAGNGRIAELVVNNFLVRNKARPFKLPRCFSPKYIQFNQHLRSALVGELARSIYLDNKSLSSDLGDIDRAKKANAEIKSWFKGHHDENWQEDFSGASYIASFIEFCG